MWGRGDEFLPIPLPHLLVLSFESLYRPPSIDLVDVLPPWALLSLYEPACRKRWAELKEAVLGKVPKQVENLINSNIVPRMSTRITVRAIVYR